MAYNTDKTRSFSCTAVHLPGDDHALSPRITDVTRRVSVMGITPPVNAYSRLDESEDESGDDKRARRPSRLGMPGAPGERKPSMVNSVFSDFQLEDENEDEAGPYASTSAEGGIKAEREKMVIEETEKRGSSSAATASDRKSVFSVQITPAAQVETPYHVFNRAKKKHLVYIVSLAGLFSPLSSNIYFPALYQISKDTGVKISLISLTVTVYMIVQGLAPAFWGPLSDTRGRRITFIGTFVVFLTANIGLACSRGFVALMVFRAMQAAGSAATISVGAGVIGDITTAQERGGFVGTFGGIRMLGQSVGPVLGGILAEYLGFRAIFWFLFLSGALTLAAIITFLPETLRRIAGNGSNRLHGVHRPLIYLVRPQPYLSDPSPDSKPAPAPAPRLGVATVISPLRFLFEKDVLVTLLFGAAVYAVWSMVTSSTASLFQHRFHLTNLQVGLVFLPNGAGCVTGSLLTGRLLDRDYRLVAADYRVSRGLAPDAALHARELADFPVARSRLRSAWYLAALFIGAVAGYGYAMRTSALAGGGRLALPLVLQFVIAYTATGLFTQNSALVVDLYPGASASATALNNLMRCSVGAAGVAAVQFAINGIGAEMTFLALALVTAVLTPLLWAELAWGEHWRKERMERAMRTTEASRAAEGGERAQQS